MSSTTEQGYRSTSWVALVGATAAGLFLASWLAVAAIEAIDPVVGMPEDLGPYPFAPSPEYLQRYNAAVLNMTTKNSMLYFGLMGASAAMAMALPRLRRLGTRGVACLVGLTSLTGCLGGYLAGWLAAHVQTVGVDSVQLLGITIDPMIQSILIQGVAWSLTTMGLFVGLALGERQAVGIMPAIGYGIVVGFGAAVLFDLLSSIVFPSIHLSQVIPAKLVVKLVWVSCACLMIVVAMIVSARQTMAKAGASKDSDAAAVEA